MANLPPHDVLQDLSPQQIRQIISDTACPQCLHKFNSIAAQLANQKNMVTSSPINNACDESLEFVAKNSTWSSKLAPNSPKSTEVATPHANPVSAETDRQSIAGVELTLDDGLSSQLIGPQGMSEEEKEQIRMSKVGRKKDFCHKERVDGRLINIVEGIELYTNVFNAEEQKRIVAGVNTYQKLGQKNQLCARTYSEPKKWMRGKGRATIQFGCCYNYAVDKDGNPPGIIRDEEVDPLPPLLRNMIKRLVRWHILPSTCVPNSCIVNIYDEGDCIPPHIDHHDFVRPFCTVSFLTESNIMFGSNLKILSPGEFSGPVSIPLPLGSVLILNGNGADVAKHCIPSVHGKRISITFRKMDNNKLPHWYRPDPHLQGLVPFMITHPTKSLSPVQPRTPPQQTPTSDTVHKNNAIAKPSPSKLNLDEFPALGSTSTTRKKGSRR